MDHHIIASDPRDLLTHWSEGTIEQQQQQQPQQPGEDHNKPQLGHHGPGPVSGDGSCELLGKQKSRRSLTEAERGLTAEPNALRPPTTKAGKQRIRMKWSNDVNQFIMRTYYTITSNETQTKSYRDHLHRLFALQYPDVAISQQRIADQRRAIVKNNLLPKGVLEAIKEEVALSLQMKSYSSGLPTTIVKQEVPSAHILSSHHLPVSSKASSINHSVHQHQQQQQQQQQQQLHSQAHHIHSHPMQTQGGSIHQAQTAAALQNQPHIIIRVNSTNPHGSPSSSASSTVAALKHHFGDEGSSI